MYFWIGFILAIIAVIFLAIFHEEIWEGMKENKIFYAEYEYLSNSDDRIMGIFLLYLMVLVLTWFVWPLVFAVSIGRAVYKYVKSSDEFKEFKAQLVKWFK